MKNNPELEIKKTITIPEEFTSSLIGPKGCNITELRKKAKAKIFIGKALVYNICYLVKEYTYPLLGLRHLQITSCNTNISMS